MINHDQQLAARRRFLANCGKFAVATPPAVMALLSVSKQSFAVSVSGNPGNNKPVGKSGEFPPGKGPGGTGDKGNSR